MMHERDIVRCHACGATVPTYQASYREVNGKKYYSCGGECTTTLAFWIRRQELESDCDHDRHD